MNPRKFSTVTDTCRRLGIRPHVLRYWEKEFEFKFKRNSAGRRIVSQEQLAKLELIRHLLHSEKLTAAGARRRLEKVHSAPPAEDKTRDRRELLLWLKRELLRVRTLLEPSGPTA